MSFSFRPAADIHERHGLFVALVGGTNSGKTYSALRLARGIAGPKGKIAVADTEGGRTLHLKKEFAFDVAMLDPPHRPQRYAQLARDAEAAGYDALVIDSFSAEWAGLGGVLQWSDEEAQRMAGGDERKLERVKGASWIKPKQAHKSMVYSLLERRIPIIFSIRGEETFKPPNEKFFKAICNQGFLFEVTVSFRLATERKGIIDLSDPKSWKMEGAHAALFKHGEQLCERHGEALAAWARGDAPATAPNSAAQGQDRPPLPKDPPGSDPAPRPENGSPWRLIRTDGKPAPFPDKAAFFGGLSKALASMEDDARIDAFLARNGEVLQGIRAADIEAANAIDDMIAERRIVVGAY